MNYAIYSSPPPIPIPHLQPIFFFFLGGGRGDGFGAELRIGMSRKNFSFAYCRQLQYFDKSISNHFVNLLKIKNFFTSVFLFYIFTDILRQSCPAHQLQYAYAIYFRLDFHNFNVEPSPQKNYIVLD